MFNYKTIIMKRLHFLTTVAAIAFVSSSYAQTYRIDTDASVLNWTGQKVTGKHHGNVHLKSGSFTVEGGEISQGTFTIDMTSITNSDVENDGYKQKLVGHLKSDDFFGVEKFPEATFKVTESSKISGGNANITGDLTIKGITHPISFKAVLHDTGDAMKVYGNIVIDRTLYDVKFGSGKFFEGLADNTIYDEFTINLNVHSSEYN